MNVSMQMVILTIVLVFGLYAVFALGTDYYLKKKYKIDRHASPLPPKAKSLQMKWMTALLIVYVIAIIGFLFWFEESNIIIILFPFIVGTTLVRGLIEKKYNEEAKVWILEFNSGFWTLLFFSVVLLGW